MFLLDSLMISGIQWALKTVVTAAEAEMNDDSALRDQLLAAEMRRETGEISDAEFADIEADLLARIREIKDRREGTGPLGFEANAIEAGEGQTFNVEAEVSGDFHERSDSERSDRSEGPDHAGTARTTRTTRTARTPRTSRTNKR